MDRKKAQNIAQALLGRAHPPDTAEEIYIDKVVRRPLTIRPTSPDPTSQDARASRRLQRLRKEEHRRRRQKPKPLSAKEKRDLEVYDIPKEAQKYDLYIPLHRLWLGYMWEILGLKAGEASFLTATSIGSRLASADFHGAELEVVRSTCVGRVGCRGIVLKDTKFTFQVITQRNTMRTIPKRDTMFRFEIQGPQQSPVTRDENGKVQAHLPQAPLSPPYVFELHGSQFENRATDRATRKFKQKRMDHL